MFVLQFLSCHISQNRSALRLPGLGLPEYGSDVDAREPSLGLT
jgi:hypothetical protein